MKYEMKNLKINKKKSQKTICKFNKKKNKLIFIRSLYFNTYYK